MFGIETTKELIPLIQHINNFSSDINDAPENIIYSKYYYTNPLPTVKEFIFSLSS